MKICKTCNEELHESEFYKRKDNKDGLYTDCKLCHKQKVADYQKTPEGKETVQRYITSEKGQKTIKKHRQRPEFRRQATRKTQQWRRDNPEAYQAHSTVHSALLCGRLKKKPCEVCGDKNSEAHHPDYNKPLRVRWLCKYHHEIVHHQ